jgi:hypothetical protein
MNRLSKSPPKHPEKRKALNPIQGNAVIIDVKNRFKLIFRFLHDIFYFE